MATAASEFEPWLNDKLKALNTDESVFGSYISGILDGDESFDDKKEALEGILSEIVVRITLTHCDFYENLNLHYYKLNNLAFHRSQI